MATTENTLRTRQNMEVLDVWKNLSSQVNALTKRQIAVFPDTVKPKTQRDLEVEVNVDKTVEALNNALETRLANLEFVLKNDAQLGAMARMRPPPARRRMVIDEEGEEKLPPPTLEPTDEVMTKEERKKVDKRNAEKMRKYNEKLQKMTEERLKKEAERAESERKIEERIRGEQKENIKLLPFQNSYQEVINTGSVVSQWNTIVRFYQKQGLSKQSQEMVKVKVQDLIPNLEAIVYGLGEAVDVLFATNNYNNNVGLKILELLRTQSVYQLIKRQIDTTSFEIVSVFALDTAFKNIFAELSEERRELLDELANRETGSIASRPIRQVPSFSSKNFDERLKALSDEMGINVKSLNPDLIAKLKALNKEDFEKYAMEAFQSVRQQKKGLSLTRATLLGELRGMAVLIGKIQRRLSNGIPEQIALKGEMITVIDNDELKEPPPDEPLEDVGDEPQPPNPDDYFDLAYDEDGNEEKIWNENKEEADWDTANRDFNDALAEYQRKVENNQRIAEQNRLNEIARADKATQQEERANLVREIAELEASVPSLEARLQILLGRLEEKEDELSEFMNTTSLEAYTNALKNIADAYAGKLQKTRGKGMPIDSRGLAGMGSHYGAEDDSEEEDSESESESDEEDPLSFDDRRNDSYYSRPIRRR